MVRHQNSARVSLRRGEGFGVVWDWGERGGIGWAGMSRCVFKWFGFFGSFRYVCGGGERYIEPLSGESCCWSRFR